MLLAKRTTTVAMLATTGTFFVSGSDSTALVRASGGAPSPVRRKRAAAAEGGRPGPARGAPLEADDELVAGVGGDAHEEPPHERSLEERGHGDDDVVVGVRGAEGAAREHRRVGHRLPDEAAHHPCAEERGGARGR